MSDYDGVEVAWGPEPVEATLRWGPRGVGGFLTFTSPKTGKPETIYVTTGPTTDARIHGQHVWSITVEGDIATVAPSLHYIGHFHSGNPARFRIVG